MTSQKTCIGFVGGSGLYDMPGLENVKTVEVETPFGMPSDSIVTGTLNGVPVAFLPRHGRGHRLLPSEVPYRANIFALKKLGVSHIVSITAVGSLKEEHAPGSIVIPDQILDRTLGIRPRTFFGEGIVGHVSFGDPYCPELRGLLQKASVAEGKTAHNGGTLVVVEGPRFSSRAESHSFRAMGCDIIGMTAMPEAILCREAEIPYATLAFVTDYDCWREGEEAVSVEAVIAVLNKNVETGRRIAKRLTETIPSESTNPIFNAAQYAIMTHASLIPVETKRKLADLYGRYWNT